MKRIYMAVVALLCLFMVSIPAVAEEPDNISASGTTSTINVSGSMDEGIYAVVVQLRDVSGNVVNMESTSVDASNNFSISMSGLSLTAGDEYDVYVADYNGGAWKSTKVTPTAPASNPSEDDSPNSDDKEETKDEEKVNTLTPETKAVTQVKSSPNITEVEPTVNGKEQLSVPVDNIEADLPDAISEDVKEKLVEQVAETVSELVDSILAGDDNVGNAVSEETLENIKTALEENKTIIAVVTVDVVDENSIPAEDKASIEEAISKDPEGNIEVACYLDLGILIKTTEGEILGTYDELPNTIVITIEAPKDMPCPEGKEYVVIRIHNGESTILPVTVNADGTLSFETNEFSTYALAFMDKREVAVTSVVKEELQKSSDTTDKGTVITPSVQEKPVKDKPKGWLWAVLGLIVIVGGAAVFFALKKKDE